MSKTDVAIIDYGMGNLHSVASALKKVSPDSQVQITADSDIIDAADRVIFPGVGAIRDCMAEIRRLKFDALVKKLLDDGKPVLAVCVGMQSLLTRSEENNGIDCINAVPGTVDFFCDNPIFTRARDESSASGERLKVPHMGWNSVEQTLAHPLWHKIPNRSRFYFVHSYFVNVIDADILAGRTHYGIEFVSAIARGTLFATQFHPEKSHTAGLQLLENFISWDGQF